MANRSESRGSRAIHPALVHLRHRPLPPLRAFFGRLLRTGIVALLLIAGALGIGIAGYRALEGMGWVDALFNAAMLLTGMGTAAPLATDGGKLFATAYALFSGIVFATSIAVFLSPLVQRFLHHFHLSLYETDGAAREEIPR